MTRVAAAIVLVSAVALAGEAQVSRRNPADAPRGFAIIRGRVLAADGDVPVRNARVRLIPATGLPRTVTSDAEGRFEFTSVADGRYTVEAAKPGLVTARFGARQPNDRPTAIQVVSASLVDRVDIRLSKSAALSGRIIDDRGDPVTGVTVTAETAVGSAARTAPSAASQTNDLGEFRLGGLSAGDYLVVANAGQVLAALALNAAWGAVPPGVNGITAIGRGDPGGIRIYYPGVSSTTLAQPIAVLEGEQRSNLDFRLEPNQMAAMSVRFGAAPAVLPERFGGTGIVAGRILRQDGQPLPQSLVVLLAMDGGAFSWRTLTDNDGSYQFSNVPPGEYTISAHRKGYVSFELGQRGVNEDGQRIRLQSAQKRDRIDITLPRLSTVAGRILDEYGDPIEGARVQVYRMRFGSGRRRLVEMAGGATRDTDDLGRYRIPGLQPGEYIVGAFAGQLDRQPMADLPGYAPTYFPGTPSAPEAQSVTAGLAQDAVSIDFALARVTTARIAGTAVTSNGEPFQGELLLSQSERSGAATTTPLSARADRDGAFEFPNVPPGDYVIQAYTGWISPSSEGELASQFVTVNGADIAGLVLQTFAGSQIAGRIRFEDGNPRAANEIELTAQKADLDLAPLIGAPAHANIHDGWTFVSGVSGPRRLRLTQKPAGWGLKGIFLDGVDVTDTPLAYGQSARTVRGMEVVLTTRITEVSGAVTDGAGAPVGRCSVTIFSDDRQLWYHDSRFLAHAACGRNGAFTIAALPAGDYLLAAIAGSESTQPGDEWKDPAVLEGLAPTATRIVLSEGQKLAVGLRVVGRLSK